jgi:hypothetical protein
VQLFALAVGECMRLSLFRSPEGLSICP